MENISPKQILFFATPLLIIYAFLGQAANGHWLLTQWGVSGFWLDLGPHLYQFMMITILLCIIPMIWIKTKAGSEWGFFGTHKGNWKFGRILLCIMPIAIPMLYIGSNDPELIAEYPLVRSVIGNWGWFILYEIIYGLMYYVPYEFHFRGFLQLGLSKTWKPIYSILLVTVITTALHWMKPMSEIISAFIVGFFFGYLAQKSDSWVYVWAIHFLVGISTDLFCTLRFLALI